ncbi:hypothetical protein [Pseudobutyrivibrio ruminis]|uniref:hypothetical protein n=1 Tax=Pseudobutyrivibrio ruminis TaxID=46206 RepID=UPI00051BB331|nr:hypothetical protein [Pseudobutyrivibrio ruminis]
MNKLTAVHAYKRQFNHLLVQELKLHLPNQLISLRVEETEDETLIFAQFGDSDDLALFPISQDMTVFIELATNAPVEVVTDWFNNCTMSLANAITIAYDEFMTNLNLSTSINTLIEMVNEMKHNIPDKNVKFVHLEKELLR